MPGRAAAVREVVRVSRLWATEGGLDFIGEDVCGLGRPTPLPTVAGKDTVKAEQGGEEEPTEVLADDHPDNDQGAFGYRLFLLQALSSHYCMGLLSTSNFAIIFN